MNRSALALAILAGSMLFRHNGTAIAACNTTLDRCQTIMAAGSYCLKAGPTLTSAGGDCMVVDAPNVYLESGGGPDTIEGAGSGAGIHVTTKATGFAASFFCPLIKGFSVGLQIDADGTIIWNDHECPLTTDLSDTVGVYLNHVRNVQYYGGWGNVEGSSAGLLIKGGGGNYIQGSTTVGGDGYLFQNQAFISSLDGIRIRDSNSNTIYGVYAGSSPQGIDLINSFNNVLIENTIEYNSYGIRVRSTSANNVVLRNRASANTIWDQFQGGNGCTNVWSLNNFLTANLRCIN